MQSFNVRKSFLRQLYNRRHKDKGWISKKIMFLEKKVNKNCLQLLDRRGNGSPS